MRKKCFKAFWGGGVELGKPSPEYGRVGYMFQSIYFNITIAEALTYIL